MTSLDEDTWNLILCKVFDYSINSFLNLSSLNVTFNKLINESIEWSKLLQSLDLEKPSDKARKFKTCKSVILKNRGKFCELCKTLCKTKVLCFMDGTDRKSYACESCRFAHVVKYYIETEDIQNTEETSSTEQRRKITKTDAKSQYMLSDANLQPIPCTLHRNPIYHNAYPMSLYDHNTIEKLAIAIHGSLDHLAGIFKNRQEIARKRHATQIEREKERKLQREIECNERKLQREIECNERRRILRTELAKYNMKVRNDSILCHEYIFEGRGSIANIVCVMIEMSWFFKYTTYESDRFVSCRKFSDRGKAIAMKKWCESQIEQNGDIHLESPNSPPKTLHNLLKRELQELIADDLSIPVGNNVRNLISPDYIKQKRLENYNRIVDYYKHRSFTAINLKELVGLHHYLYNEIFDPFIVIPEPEPKRFTNTKCSCGNTPSPVCGNCRSCCNGCERHYVYY